MTTTIAVDDIIDGKFDRILGDLTQAIKDRQAKVRPTLTVKDFPVGTRVVFNEMTAGRTHVGNKGTIIEHRQKKVVVRADEGTYGARLGTDGKPLPTICPLGILDRIS